MSKYMWNYLLHSKLVKIIVILAFCVVTFIILKDRVFDAAVTMVVSKSMGAPVSIKGASLELFKQRMRIRGMRIYNPLGFPKEVYADISSIMIEYDLAKLIKGEIKIPLMVMHIKSVVATKNAKGKLNVDSFAYSGADGTNSSLPMQIDTFSLSVDEAVYQDFSKNSDTPTVQFYDLNIKNKTYRNLKNFDQLASFITVVAFRQTAVKSAAVVGATAVGAAVFWPVGAAMVADIVVRQDSATAEFDKDYDFMFDAVLDSLKEQGTIRSETKSKGLIKAKIDGYMVAVGLTKLKDGNTKVKVSARKYFIGRTAIARGVLYKIAVKAGGLE